MKLDRLRVACFVFVLTCVSGSAVILLGASTAQSSQDDSKPAAAVSSVAASVAASVTASGDSDQGCLSDPSVLVEIKQKKLALDQRERDLVAKESELKARESAIGDEMKKLDDLRDQITGLQSARQKGNADKVAKVVATLEGMSPKAAAQMLNDLDDGLAVSAIAQMSTAKLSKVMNALDPKRAARLTELLAGVVRARDTDASNDAAAATNLTKGGKSNDKQYNKQPESIISNGPEQFAGRGTASAGQSVPSGQ